MNKSFSEQWVDHLTNYLKNELHCEADASHSYIPKDRSIYHNIIEDAENFVKLVGKPHKQSYHLNSSQVMCYNFFRHLTGNVFQDDIGYYCKPTELFVSFLKDTLQIDADINSGKCRFEYIDTPRYDFKVIAKGGKGESTNFDFYFEDNSHRIYFEIKYTEPGFGKWPASTPSEGEIKNHKSYFETGYRNMIMDCCAITEEMKTQLIADEATFDQFYQLYRNLLRASNTADNKTNISVILYPRANSSARDEIERFLPLINQECNLFKLICWEEIDMKYYSKSFYDKYICFLK